jgi:hypothetical protein
MANEDIIGLTVNGESVATFYVPNVGHKLKAGEYQIVNVGGILEVSVALVKDINKAFEFKKEIPLEIIPPAETLDPVVIPHVEDKIIPIAVPPKKARKPRELKQKDQVDSPIVPEEPIAPPVTHPVVSGEISDARLSNLKKMIGFYCRVKNMDPKNLTVEILRKEAPDIGENDSDETIQTLINALKA